MTNNIVSRNWRYEQEIAGLLWKVNIEDVQGFDRALNGSKVISMYTQSTQARLSSSTPFDIYIALQCI